MLYRQRGNGVEVLLVHPGGPFFAKKDAGVWSIPKGEFTEGEEPLVAAKREFAEELGSPAPDGVYLELGQARLPSGKVVHAWAVGADFDAGSVHSNTFKMEWPAKSGRQQSFPEVDRAAWLPLTTALTKIAKGQVPLLQTLTSQLGTTAEPPERASLF